MQLYMCEQMDCNNLNPAVIITGYYKKKRGENGVEYHQKNCISAVRAAAIAITIVCSFMLSACASLTSDVDNMLNPPRPAGELNDIQKALESSVTGNIVMLYPSSGEDRSAFVQHDVDGDGVSEAIAFYSTAPETGVSVVHISLIDNIDGVWQVMGDVIVQSGNGIDQVQFADLDGDGIVEIIVGCTTLSATEKRLLVFHAKEKRLIQRIDETYTQFLTCDLNMDGKSELLVITLDTTMKTSAAKLYTLDAVGKVVQGSTNLDGEVTGYVTPLLATLNGGVPAVYLDAYKGTNGMITEVLCYTQQNEIKMVEDNSLITNAGKPEEYVFTNMTVNTRPSRVECRDIDKDGVPEIPFLSILPGFEKKTDEDKVYMTTWQNYNGKQFTTVFTGVMNYTDDYSLQFPESWINSNKLSNITLLKEVDNKRRTFYVWNSVDKVQGAELLVIQTLTEEAWRIRDTNKYEGYIVLEARGGMVYVAKISQTTGIYAITEAELRENFNTLD